MASVLNVRIGRFFFSSVFRIFCWGVLSKMSDKRSVEKLKLFNSLCDSGCKPPKNTKAYEEKVQEHLYRLLCVDRQEVSEATAKVIDDEANHFRQSATQHFKRVGNHYERMKAGDYLKGHISVEIWHISEDIPFPRRPTVVI